MGPFEAGRRFSVGNLADIAQFRLAAPGDRGGGYRSPG